jgi:branched-chain amino acid transport system substrate-binding protein
MATRSGAGRARRWSALLALTAAALAACGGGQGGGSEPIKLGGIFTLTPQAFGNDTQKMVQTVFNQVNAAGGIGGRQIQYLSGDDAGNPSKAAELAREFAGQDGVVAMVGSASFVDCGTNNGYYQQQGVLSIQAIGADPYCFTTPSITPVNLGPYTSITADLYYASQFLHDTRICTFISATPGSHDSVVRAIQRWTTLTGQRLLIADISLPLTQTDFTPELLRAKSAGCDAVFYNGADVVALSILKVAHNQGMENVDFLFDAPAYTAQLAQSAAGLGVKAYLASEFEPFTANSSANAGWRAAAERGHVPETSFSQGGYVAAQWMLSVLRSIKGPITREAVTDALLGGTPFHTPMVGSPLVFGRAKAHAPNQAIKMVSLKNGTWEVVNQQFFHLAGSPT